MLRVFSGMSAALAFSQHPDRFEVKLYERSANLGGMATSEAIDSAKYGASYVNDGVQGGSPAFANTFAIFEKLGFQGSEVGFQISFGRDSQEEFWSNVFPSEVIDKFGPDIKKFGKVLKIIKSMEPVFAFIPVSKMLPMFGFSQDFGERIVYPLVALFFGTGNQTPYISSAILERVFMDPSMKLFEYSSSSFLASIPEMRAFPRLSLVYEAWKKEVEEKSNGSVSIVTCREVTQVKRTRKSVTVWSRKTRGTNNDQEVEGPGTEMMEEFDQLILAVDADAALNILNQDASWMEKRVLGNVKYLWDITITHNDLDYMKKYYCLEYDPSLRSKKRLEERDEEALKQFDFAEKNFRPLYYVRSYPSDKTKIEMSFDLTNYQPQFKGESAYGPGGSGRHNERDESPSEDTHSDRKVPKDEYPPLSDHVFQTIFLDKHGSEELWTRDDIAKDKVILEKWWKQQSHRWQHYAGTVPWMMWINGRNRTHYAGAWTILNMHEIAVVSGFAAAYRLGAEYPFKDSEECKRLFTLYLGASHGVRMRSGDRQGLFK
ncbi:hypothetical protein NEOLEDRAFT_1055262 [Neolentinus lepideus HHB14362 ss-1]|uniref:FAD/NAD(P)-binding domain-containing protein n=1 Tax=Neolentinus lepideus HHB14362 ss-1 TaxID=1314782 RepID=A0A165VFQ9_9AGAM|nr:hypothetical protein NEOLEDRAFT_1055262 [Neolentinus lepideus HHB14362 ss-1]